MSGRNGKQRSQPQTKIRSRTFQNIDTAPYGASQGKGHP